MPQYTDPSNTLALLDQLEAIGFSDKAFSIIHHFEKPESIASHRRYCEMLQTEGSHFRTPTNQRVQKRLSVLARICEAVGFESKSSLLFEHLSEVALLEVPHDRRPLSEQVKLAERDNTAT
jgi:hypothetical protein